MKELIKRTLSGIVFVACVVGSILWNEYAFCSLFLLISVLAVDEFHRLVQSERALRVYAFLTTVVQFTAFFFFSLHTKTNEDFHMVLVFILEVMYLLLTIFALLDEIWNHSNHPLQNWGNLLISQIMIGAPIASLCLICYLDWHILLALFILIWTNDTGAYCVGSLTAKLPKGNHKMAPHVSPKKSWEGLIGGFLFALGAAFILWSFGWFDSIIVADRGIYPTCIFAFIVSAVGTMGDLMESIMKRSLGVKDSGKFLPGHGGVLDRFDSILLAAPIIASFSWLCYFLVPLF